MKIKTKIISTILSTTSILAATIPLASCATKSKDIKTVSVNNLSATGYCKITFSPGTTGATITGTKTVQVKKNKMFGTVKQPTATLGARKFLCWTDSSTNKNYTSSTPITTSTTLYPVFEEEKATYTLKFGNGQADQTNTVTLPATITLPTPTYEGHIFQYWLDSDGNQHKGDTVVNLTKDVVFTAIWIQPAVSYTVSFFTPIGKFKKNNSSILCYYNVSPGQTIKDIGGIPEIINTDNEYYADKFIDQNGSIIDISTKITTNLEINVKWDNFAPQLEKFPSAVTCRVIETTKLSKYMNGVTGDDYIQYSLDSGATWVNLVNEITIPANTNFYIKGKHSCFSTRETMCKITLSGGKVNLGGNVLGLLDGGLGTETSVPSYCFKFLFQESDSIYKVSKTFLPSLSVSYYSYRCMFWNCVNLVQAPDLPAETLKTACYMAMFSQCSALVLPPKISAKILGNQCCFDMFSGCTSLTTAPELPATTLDEECYYQMFKSCTHLKNPPKLPATTLKNGCYHNMFQGCTYLTKVPELPATTLVDYCYNGMFISCASLKINENGTGTKIFTCPSLTDLNNPVTNMFTSTIGTFTSTPTAGNSYYFY